MISYREDGVPSIDAMARTRSPEAVIEALIPGVTYVGLTHFLAGSDR